jgi:malate dehydrogenase
MKKPACDIDGMVIGGHGDTTMIPLIRLASYNGIPINQFLTEKNLNEVSAATMVGGATLTKLLGTSAWYAPGASVSYLVDSILSNQKKIIPCSVMLNGEYGLNDICIGVPVVIGSNGVEEIIDVNLNEIEKEKLQNSASAVANMNAALNTILN